MVSPSQFASYVYGSLRLARLDRQGLQFFGNTPEAFWQSFQAAVIVAPVFVVFKMTQLTELTVDSGPVSIVVVNMLMYVISWVLFPLVMLSLTEAIGKRDQYCQYITAYNWSQVLWLGLLLIVLLLRLSGILPPSAVSILFWILQALILLWAGFIARAALGVTIPGAAGIVILDFGLDLLIELTTAVTLGMHHAP